MKKYLLTTAAAALLAAGSSPAQTGKAGATPAPAPQPAPSATEPADPSLVEPPQDENKPDEAVDETQLISSGSFERPRVQGRTPRAQGGDPMKSGHHEWVRFEDKPDEANGKLIAGYTNEIGRTGRQSLYVEFDKLTAAEASANLASNLIPIHPDKPYRVGIWGRLDKKKPLTIDQRLPFLRLQVDFFQEDQETQAGEAVYKIQPMPGTKNRPPLFTTGKWFEYFAKVHAPADAAFIKVTWTWGVSGSAGETNGVIYFDDATIQGAPPATDETPEEKPEAGAPQPGAAQAAESAPATPAAPAAPESKAAPKGRAKKK